MVTWIKLVTEVGRGFWIYFEDRANRIANSLEMGCQRAEPRITQNVWPMQLQLPFI